MTRYRPPKPKHVHHHHHHHHYHYRIVEDICVWEEPDYEEEDYEPYEPYYPEYDEDDYYYQYKKGYRRGLARGKRGKRVYEADKPVPTPHPGPAPMPPHTTPVIPTPVVPPTPEKP